MDEDEGVFVRPDYLVGLHGRHDFNYVILYRLTGYDNPVLYWIPSDKEVKYSIQEGEHTLTFKAEEN